MKKLYITLCFMLGVVSLFSQKNVGINTLTPHESAILDISSTEKGLLVPRLTMSERDNITNPADGLLIYQINEVPGFYYFNGTSWKQSAPESLWIADGDHQYTDVSGSVGVGTKTPHNRAKFHVHTSSANQGFLVTGDLNLQGELPDLGTGSRMMFYPSKAAFRAGSVVGNAWSNDSVGIYSTALGQNTKAIGENTFAYGQGTRALGSSATAGGLMSVARGVASTSLGLNSMALGHASVALGASSVAAQQNSVAIGFESVASARNAIALNGGNAQSEGAFSVGELTNAQGENSTAMGTETEALGSYSIAAGFRSTAHKYGASVLGHQCNAHGVNSSAIGLGLLSNSHGEVVIGNYNTNYVPASSIARVDTDRLFVIGNGHSVLSRKDALVMLKNGKTGFSVSNPHSKIHVDGSLATKVKSVAFSYEASDNDHIISIDASGGYRDVKLPSPIGIKGRQYIVKKADNSANDVGILATDGSKIDGVAFKALVSPYEFIVVVSDGDQWLVIGKG